MTASARDWLAQSAPAAAPSLAERMASAALASEGETLPAELMHAALDMLNEALIDCDRRTSALPLLAADALLTAACQAAATDDRLLEQLCNATTTEQLARITGVQSK